KVLENLSKQAHKTMEPEFYQQHTALLQEQIDAFQLEIARLQDEHPHLRSLATDRLRQELIAIEAEIYADYMRAGLLKYKPEPLLPEMFISKGFLERP
ncbi:MAG: sodium:proton antiporter, partial [Gemmatimonadaceae bacterium]|nr:sodium:proton antiporter [Gloeobacterales cyanobacterium ES-bin-141]